ncbi:Cytochrome c biogenesis protein CcsA [Saezia sanguinis]|uniref:Cytochrome c biogenesis protein CcsA n=1 Tax=Saezia sanguinis TaxID=1965230 RepID=A0A433SAQ4_9BURK|nr:cytochrome c biogenesis protein CcsA [Saezia sanguinis]RUS65810.1 Cytochrome c biogenesis protein CcsA [Saezia sanguinis]
MTWSWFPPLALAAICCWLLAGVLAYLHKRRIALVLQLAGILILVVFIAGLWHTLQRPPLRTMGETRLWYAFFLSIAGLLVYWHWKYRWLLLFAGMMAAVFMVINIVRPEIHSITLVPALQSPWFIPHVTVYIFSYAMLGVATIAGVMQLVRLKKNNPDPKLDVLIDNITCIGFGFLMLGVISGALWAKMAWGHYWSWDPKETWAFITATVYLGFIHLRLHGGYTRQALWLLPVALVLLMMAWIGVNYLPSAQGSIHVYS